MNEIFAFITPDFLKKFFIGFIALALAVGGSVLWLAGHDANTRSEAIAQNDAEWKLKLAEAKQSVRIDTVYRTVPARPFPPQTKPAAVVQSNDHQNRLDSVNAYWTSCNARKDSLLEIYTQDRDAPFEDSLQEHIVTFSPLGTFDQSPLSFRLFSTAKEQKVPAYYVNTQNFLPEEEKWYQTRTAYFIYGCVATTAAFYGAKQLR